MSWLRLIAVLPAALVINEVLYDPPGPDSGHEFVELYNPGPAPVELEGFELRFVNGTSPVPSELIWRGDPHALAAGAFFVVGGDQVEGRDRTANLGLQNGDEALLLLRDAELVDVVAWGEDLGLGEGQPVSGGSGLAVGRVPDGQDTADNRTDFRELPVPTPGSENLAEERFDLAGWWTEPAWREDAGTMRLRIQLLANGWGLRQTGTARLWGQHRALEAMAGETVELEFERDVVPGAVPSGLQLIEGSHGAGVDSLPVRCGITELVITEVQPRPADGEPEWLELHNRGSRRLQLDGWGLRDRGGRRRGLGTDLVLDVGERVVFTADARQLSDRYDSPARFLEPDDGWPTLNDTDPGGGASADSLYLVAPGGAIVDLVTWVRSDLTERGRPLQRSRIDPGRASLWLPSVDGPTPGTEGEGERRLWPEGGMLIRPDPFTPDGDGIADELEILLTAYPVRAVSVFDLQGDLVRALDITRAGDRAIARWDGTDARGRGVPAGAWVIVAEPEGSAGALRRVVGLGRIR